MKKLFLLIFVLAGFSAFAQQSFSFEGLVIDGENKPLIGAHVFIDYLNIGTITNEEGMFKFDKLNPGTYEFTVSLTGFETHKRSINFTSGEWSSQVTVFQLQQAVYQLEGITVTAQKKVEQIKNVPISINAIEQSKLDDASIIDLGSMADYIPGLNVRIQSNQRPNFIIRGLTSDEVSPNAQPRVSLFFNDAPITRASGGVMELYDMERVEVVKGPQGTLFGRGAQIGAIHFMSKRPEADFNGYVSAGIGNYAQKNFSTAINVPLIENRLFTRIAAVYHTRDGYVKNTFGGTLNGKDTKGFRFSTRYLASKDTKIDFVFNYQEDRAPGVAFISTLYPNTNGDMGSITEASLDKGEDLRADKDLLNLNLNFKHFFNTNLYLTAITSYQTNKSYELWDGDGSAAAAINMSENNDSKMFNQEVRLNYEINNKIRGFSGVNFLKEKVEQTYGFQTNEQHMIHLFLDKNNMILPDGTPFSMPTIPNIPQMFGPIAGMPLALNHEEESYNTAENTSFEFFSDVTFDLSEKFSLSAGFRFVFDNSTVTNWAQMTGGDVAMLGNFTQNFPNIFFRPSTEKAYDGNFSGLTGRLVAMYKLDENSNIFGSYSRGRRPNVIQYQADGTVEVMQDEVVDNFEIGYKTVIDNKFIFDATAFLYKYKHFQTNAWIADPSTGNFAYLIKDAGKATSYGLETSFQWIVNKNLSLNGNYTYIHARFDDENSEGEAQEYAGNKFRLTPDHSFNFNLKYQGTINDDLTIFAIPSVSFKSTYYFEDANVGGMLQQDFWLANISTGLKLADPNMQFTVFVQNLFDKEYLLSMGNTGSLFGIPTYIPAMPRTFGAKITWNF